MSSIHKRLHYAQKQEFQMLAKGFSQFLPDEYPYDVPGASRTVKKKDFDNLVAILPVADPNIFSSAQRVTLAQTQLQLAQSAPQMHNMYEAYHRMYAALNVRDIDAILTPQNIDHPKDPATENSDAMNGMPLKAFAGQQHDAHIVSHLMLGLSPTVQANPAAAVTLQQHLFEHLRIKAEEQVAAELFNQYGTDPKDMVSVLQKEGMIAAKIAQYMQEIKQIQTKLSGDQSDPLVEVKKEEIAANAKNDAAEIAFKQQKLQQDMQIEQKRIGSQEQIAMLRANTPAFKGAPPNATSFGKQ